MMNLSLPEVSYLIGLAQSDGHHYKGRGGKGTFQLELKSSDKAILEDLALIIPVYSSVVNRTRVTNFSQGKDYETSTLTVSNQDFRRFIEQHGVLTGKKSRLIEPPKEDHSKVDYFRGIIDGDGSVGVTARGYPFISLVTASEPLARSFESFIFEVTGAVRNTKRNARDDVFNIMITNSLAVKIASKLYYPGAIALERKADAAADMSDWTPANYRFSTVRTKWDASQDAVVLANTNAEAASLLGRTEKSVQVRRSRINSAMH